MLADPLGTPTSWARAAGYDDKTTGARVNGHLLSHNPKVEAAIQEVSRRAAHTLGPLVGVAVALQIARNPNHPKQLQAAVALMDRGGLPATSEQNIKVSHTDETGATMVERIRSLATALGMDAAQLLGANAADHPKLIEGTKLDET